MCGCSFGEDSSFWCGAQLEWHLLLFYLNAWNWGFSAFIGLLQGILRTILNTNATSKKLNQMSQQWVACNFNDSQNNESVDHVIWLRSHVVTD